jgi:flagellar basal body-associated protein FliL
LEEQVKRTDKERKAMANTVKDAKKNWLIIGIIIMFVVAGAGFILYLASSGAFDHIIPQIGTSTLTPAGPPKNLNDFAQKYPSCDKLQTALDSGEIKLSDVPQAGKDMLKICKSSTITPTK